MSLSIVNNVAAAKGHRMLGQAQGRLHMSMERLISGARINRASDDPAGMAVSTRLSADAQSMQQVQKNTRHILALLDVAEGGMYAIASFLPRLRELAMQAATDTNASDLASIEDEYQGQIAELTRVAQTTEYNNMRLLNRSGPAGLTNDYEFQIGINTTSSDTLTLSTNSMASRVDILGLHNSTVATKSDAETTIGLVDVAIERIATKMSLLAAARNKVEGAEEHVETMRLSHEQAAGRIRDADLALESAQVMRQEIILRSGSMALAQSNQQPLIALELIR